MPTKAVSIRDPLWGYIDLSERETTVVDSPLFQRLRDVKQLSFADYVYPSATHNRFGHSLGAMHVADILSRQIGLSDHDKEIVRMSCLVHDIGHGPFSHLFEDIHREASGRKEPTDHEAVTRAIVDLNPSMREALGTMRPEVLATLSGERGVMSEIVSSGLDADRFDYLLRDSHHAGVVYGHYDFHRLRHTLIQHGSHLAIKGKGMDAVEGFRLAREQMSFQVYYHHTKIVAERMLVRAVTLAASEGLLDRASLDIDEKNPAKWPESLWFAQDHKFVAYLEDHVKGPSRDILDALMARRLLKRAYLAEPEAIPPVARGEVQSESFDSHAMEEAVARAAGLPANQVIVAKPEISTKQYRSVAAKEPILILPEGGDKLVEYEKIARLQGPTTDPWRLIVYAPKEYESSVRRASIEFLNSMD